jgi:hypothetical protein
MTMPAPAADQSAENIRYVRGLLRDKDPAFAAALELAADLVCEELSAEALTLGTTAARGPD